MLSKYIPRSGDDFVDGTPTVTINEVSALPTLVEDTEYIWQVEAPLGSVVSWSLTGAAPLDVQMPTVDPSVLPTVEDIDDQLSDAHGQGKWSDEDVLVAINGVSIASLESATRIVERVGPSERKETFIDSGGNVLLTRTYKQSVNKVTRQTNV